MATRGGISNGQIFEELPGEVFEEAPGSNWTSLYSIHEGIVYCNWRRPAKWDDAMFETLEETFELGLGASMASWALNRSIETVDWWLYRGELAARLVDQGNRFHPKVRKIAQTYIDIYNRCMAARARGITQRVNRIESAQEWRAQAWLLEKLVPEFAAKQNISMNIDFSKLSDEEVDKIARTGKL